MSGYTKLFSSILASTIWREDMETRIVWITLLAMAGKDGIAEGSVPGLADFARVSIEGARRAIVKLSSPDPDSRTSDNEGRRIEAVDGGWRLLNHAKYRAKLSEEERREYQRLWQAKHRKEKSSGVDIVDTSRQMSGIVDSVDTIRSRVQKQNQNQTQGAAPVASGPHRSHALCGRVCVPAFLHDDFRRALGGREDEADKKLRDWYCSTLDALGDAPIADDSLRWWRDKFREWVKSFDSNSDELLRVYEQREAARKARPLATH